MDENKISVGLELDTSKYKKGIKEATDNFDEFQKRVEEENQINIDLRKLNEQLAYYQKLFDETENEISKITKNLGKEQTLKINYEEGELPSFITATGKEIKFGGESDVKITNFQDTISAIEGQEEAYKELQDDLDIYQNKILDIRNKIVDLTSAQERLNTVVKKTEDNFTGVKDGIFYINGEVRGVAKKIEDAQTEQENKQKKITDEVKKTNKQIRKSGRETHRAHSSMFSITSLIRRIGLSIRRQIVTQIASALNPLNMMKKAFSYLTDVLSPRLGATFKNIGNNLTEYFANSPLFKTMINQILYLIKLLQDAFNVVAKIFGFRQIDLFKTSKKTAKEIEKSASHTVASFDEINDIGNQQQNNDNVPLGLGELNLEDQSKKITDLVNNIIKKFKKLFDDLDFKNLGKKLGEKFTNLFTSIDWESLAEVLIGGLTGMVDLLIGMIQGINWGKVAKTISNFLVKALGKFNQWLKGIDWNKLSTDLMLAINNFVTNFDWDKVISTTFEIIGRVIGGAGVLIGNIVGAACVMIVEYFKQYLTIDAEDEWYEIGAKIIWAILKGLALAPIQLKFWAAENIYLPLALGILESFGVKFPEDFKTKLKAAFNWKNIQSAFNSLKENFPKVWSYMFDSNGPIGKFFTTNYWKNKFNNIKWPKIKLSVTWTSIDKTEKLKTAIAKALFDTAKWPKLSLSSYAVGSNYIPYDQLAYLHEGEAVIPKKFNDKEYFGGTNDDTNALLEILIDRVDNLELSPYITVKDIGQASLNYINNKSRITGRSVI